MKVSRFVANLSDARRNAINVLTAKNNIAREHSSELLDANVSNMIEELYTIVSPGSLIDKEALLRSLLEDAESSM